MRCCDWASLFAVSVGSCHDLAHLLQQDGILVGDLIDSLCQHRDISESVRCATTTGVPVNSHSLVRRKNSALC